MYVLEYMLPMPDGEKLFTRCVLPARTGRYPIAFSRNAYAAFESGRADVAAYEIDDAGQCDPAQSKPLTPDELKGMLPFLESGYALVNQHLRGTGASEGEFIPYQNDREDGLATVRWLRAQSFYQGELYLDGGSYNAFTVLSFMDGIGHDLMGVSLRVPYSGCYNDFYVNGFLRTDLNMAWYLGNYRKKQRTAPTDGEKGCPELLTESAFDYVRQRFPKGKWYLDRLLIHTDPDSDFWRERCFPFESAFAAQTLRAPILIIGGWQDIFASGMLDLWRNLPQDTRMASAMVVGPFTHGCAVAPADCPLPLPDNELPPHSVTTLEWYQWIRTRKEPEYCVPSRIRHYVPGAGEYYNVFDIKNGHAPCELFLAAGGRLSRESEEMTPREYDYDPLRPACFPGSSSAFVTMPNGFVPQPEPNFREDVLSFVSAPLAEARYLRGGATVTLRVSSDCPDTAFYVGLSVVTPCGTFQMRDSITSIRRETPDYAPGAQATVHMTLGAVTWVVQKGDAIRLDISSSNFPAFLCHKNGAEPINQQSTPHVAHNAVLGGSISLPFLASEDIRSFEWGYTLLENGECPSLFGDKASCAAPTKPCP